MHPSSRWSVLLAVLSLFLPGSAALAQDGDLRFGALFGGGLSGAPLGSIAERHGLYALPGLEHEARVLLGSGGHEWSLGGIWDRYRTEQAISPTSTSRFDYRSSGVVLGYSTVRRTGGVPVVYGVDLGWNHFEASSSTPSYYTGEQENSRTAGDAALLNVWYGVEIPMESVTVIPRIRLSTSYPDFGGGDGYSALHRSSDLGFKASVGVSLKKLVPLRMR